LGQIDSIDRNAGGLGPVLGKIDEIIRTEHLFGSKTEEKKRNLRGVFE